MSPLSLAYCHIILNSLKLHIFQKEGLFSGYSLITRNECILTLFLEKVIFLQLETDFLPQLMLLLEHVINDPFYLFLVITTPEKILLFLIILIPLSQKFQAILLLNPLLPLLRKFLFSLLLKSIHVMIPLSNLTLSLLTMFNNLNNLLLTTSLDHIFFINKISQYLI